MIKIELKNEKDILDFHYKNLTTKVGKEQNVINRIEKRILDPKKTTLVKNMYEYLLKNVKQNNKGFSILTAKPIELQNFIIRFRKKHLASIIGEQGEFGKIFYYDQYDKWKAYELGKKIGITVCPYCNRSYTFIIGTDKGKGTRFEYDHFYSQKSHPYLALCFYNLVPSCHICNANLKREKKFTLKSNIHPYIEGFSSNIVFSLDTLNVNFINGNPTAYNIVFKKGNQCQWNQEKVKAAFNNIKTFKLESIYNLHKDYVDEIITKSKIYSESYINDLFNTYSGTLFNSKEDIKRLLAGNYINELDYGKRVLSKLTGDISSELKLFV